MIALLLFTQSLMAVPKDLQQQILLKQQSYRDLMSIVYEINNRQKKLSSQRAQLESENQYLEIQINSLSDQITKVEEQLKADKNKIQKIFLSAYKLKNKSSLDYLSQSKSSYELNTKIKALSSATQNNLNRIQEHLQLSKELKKSKQTLSYRKEKLQEQISTLASVQANLNVEQKNKSKLVQKFRSSAADLLKKMSQHTSDFEELDFIYRNSFYDQRGLLAAPIQAEKVSSFGIFQDPETQAVFKNKGVLYKSQQPTGVSSVFEGKVLFVGEVDGFGQTVIIDHGDHFYTTYSRLNEVAVAQGQEVKTGTIIAQNTEQLYFEVRHFSEPTNPQEWLKGQRL